MEGPHLLAEALGAGECVTEVLALPEDEETLRRCAEKSVQVTLVSRPVLQRVCDTKNPRGPIAVLTIPDQEPSPGDTLWLMVSTPGNAGTLIRTAAAFGWDVAMGPAAVDPWSPKVLRAGAGGHFRAAVRRVAEAPPDALVVAARPRRGVPLPEIVDHLEMHRDWWLLIGDESRGVASSYEDRVDLWCSIPMPGGSESLNAAAAGAIVSHHLAGLRPGAGKGLSDRGPGS